MFYINIETNQYPETEASIRASNPNTSFPFPFVPSEKYQLVFASPVPTHNTVTQIAVEIAPELTSKGHWEQRWQVVPRFTEYTDDNDVVHSVAEQEAAAIQAAETSRINSIVKYLETRTQSRLDDFVATRNYSNITSAVTYENSSVPKFASEGAYAKTARDTTWATLCQILDDAKSGSREMPTKYEDIESELPSLQWPT